MTPNPPSYSSLPLLSDTTLSLPHSDDIITTGTIKSSATSSYSYSKTTRTSGAHLEELPFSQQASANSFITRVLDNKLSSTKFTSDKLKPESQLNANKAVMNKPDPKSKPFTQRSSASLLSTPPQRDYASDTHVASLSIQLAPRSPQPETQSWPETGPRRNALDLPPVVPPRPAGIVVVLLSFHCFVYTCVSETNSEDSLSGLDRLNTEVCKLLIVSFYAANAFPNLIR